MKEEKKATRQSYGEILEKLGCKLISIPCNTSTYFHNELQKHIN